MPQREGLYSIRRRTTTVLQHEHQYVGFCLDGWMDFSKEITQWFTYKCIQYEINTAKNNKKKLRSIKNHGTPMITQKSVNTYIHMSSQTLSQPSI